MTIEATNDADLDERVRELCALPLPDLLVRALDPRAPDPIAAAAMLAKLPRGWERVPWRPPREVRGGVAVMYRSELRVLLSLDMIDGEAWLHASASRWRPNKPRGELPSWAELKAVRSIFLGEEAEAVQWFPANTEEEWVDMHEALHLWRRASGAPVLPPRPRAAR